MMDGAPEGTRTPDPRLGSWLRKETAQMEFPHPARGSAPAARSGALWRVVRSGHGWQGDDTNTTYLYTDYYTAAFATSVNVGGSLASHLLLLEASLSPGFLTLRAVSQPEGSETDPVTANHLTQDRGRLKRQGCCRLAAQSRWQSTKGMSPPWRRMGSMAGEKRVEEGRHDLG